MIAAALGRALERGELTLQAELALERLLERHGFLGDVIDRDERTRADDHGAAQPLGQRIDRDAEVRANTEPAARLDLEIQSLAFGDRAARACGPCLAGQQLREIRRRQRIPIAAIEARKQCLHRSVGITKFALRIADAERPRDLIERLPGAGVERRHGLGPDRRLTGSVGQGGGQ